MSQPRTIILTGVTRGLGRAMAERFAGLGHTVLGCGRSEDALATLANKLGEPHQFRAVDIADPEQVRSWARSMIALHGAPDLVINNAGLINQNAPLWEVPAEELSRVLDVNVKGTMYVLQAFLPSMIEAGEGIAVNFSSGWGRSTAPEVAPYCASKWAIEGLSQAVAQEVPNGIAVIPVNPGVIDTAMLRSCWADGASHYPDATQWANGAVDFLLSLGPEHNGRALSVPG